MKRVFLLAFTALMAASCQKEDLGRVLTATIEQYEHNSKDGNGASKAYINDQYYACWENNDKVKINGTEYTVSISEGDEHNYSATIQGDVPTGQNLLAYYPASQVSNLTAAGGTVTLPPVQTYRESNGHQVINNPMAAYCPEGSDKLKFRNLGALLKITIQAPSNEDLNLKAIVVKGNDNQMLWGSAPLKLDYQNKPILGEMSNGGAFVFLYFESPGTISAGNSKSYYIVVPDGTSFKNFTITVATDQKDYRKETPLGHTLPRNHIGALSYTPANGDEVNAILYTGSVEGFKQDAFGDAQVSSSDGGVILFDHPLSTIGKNAFYGCGSLSSIFLPDSVTSIGENAFYGCSSLTGITLPAGVTSIGASAFFWCSSLTSITLPEGVTSIGDYAFYGCSSLTGITLPENLTEIGGSTFEDCRNLTTISLPARVTSIGDYAFAGCPNLSDITLPTNLTSIGVQAFIGCSGLTSISLPEGVTSIGVQAFIGCSGLTSISLPAGVTSIAYGAFSNCSSLAHVDCYAINPPTLGSNAFYNIPSSAVLHVRSNCVDDYSTSPWGNVFTGDRSIVGDLTAN